MAGDQQAGPGLYVKLGLNVDGIIGGVGGISLALNQSLELFSKFEGMAQGFVDLANKAGDYAHEMVETSRLLGLSIKEYQEWSHVAIASGDSMEGLTSAIRMMSVRMKEAADPTSDIGKTLKALNVDVLDSSGKMRSMNDVLLDLFPALNKLPEGFARNQIAAELFGRGFGSIIRLTDLTRDQLQQLINQAPVFSDEKINQLMAYNIQMKLLNEKLERSKVLVGSELVSSFSTWGNMIDTSLQKGQPLFVFFKDLNLLLEMTAEGFTLLGARIIAFTELTTVGGAKFGNWESFGKTISEADAAVMQMRYQFALAETGYFEGALWIDGRWQAPTKATGSPYSPPVGEVKGVLSAEEIRDKKLELRELTNITIPALTKELAAARLTNLTTDIEKATIALEKATNKATDLKKVVGEASSGIVETYNTMFASSLQAGGIGPDWGGYSELANMTADQLEKIAAGGWGQSKGYAEKAQQYLTMMKAGGKVGAAAPTKAVSLGDQAELDTKKIKTETEKQADAFTTLNDKIIKGWTDLEYKGLTHYTALAELSRIKSQAELDYMAACVNFGGEHPIIQNKIIMSATGPDWTPPAFTAITAPTLKEADFSTVIFLGTAAAKKKEEEERAKREGTTTTGGEGKNVSITVTQTNYGVKTDAEGMNKALGGLAALGGGLP